RLKELESELLSSHIEASTTKSELDRERSQMESDKHKIAIELAAATKLREEAEAGVSDCVAKTSAIELLLKKREESLTVREKALNNRILALNEKEEKLRLQQGRLDDLGRQAQIIINQK
ncbi:MAG: hypothetical protein KDA17_07700, partial [Candidatus Saccharibacteria bacterium]|nr:hypothetical protein [Candidatus Saccharibacteria bacterium]